MWSVSIELTKRTVITIAYYETYILQTRPIHDDLYIALYHVYHLWSSSDHGHDQLWMKSSFIWEAVVAYAIFHHYTLNGTLFWTQDCLPYELVVNSKRSSLYNFGRQYENYKMYQCVEDSPNDFGAWKWNFAGLACLDKILTPVILLYDMEYAGTSLILILSTALIVEKCPLSKRPNKTLIHQMRRW